VRALRWCLPKSRMSIKCRTSQQVEQTKKPLREPSATWPVKTNTILRMCALGIPSRYDEPASGSANCAYPSTRLMLQNALRNKRGNLEPGGRASKGPAVATSSTRSLQQRNSKRRRCSCRQMACRAIDGTKDPMVLREAVELVHAISRIPDPAMRKLLAGLTKAVAHAE
jgi:hypothetical protein